MAGKSEFTLKQSPVLVKSFLGCGVQLNQHVFAQQTIDLSVPEASFGDLKAKVKALAPHFVRIFYNDDQEGVPFDKSLPSSPVNKRQGPMQRNRWASFVEVVGLAQEIRATINITWQGGKLVTDHQRKTAAARFANVLEILVKGGAVKGGATGLRWVTIANEPNTVPAKGKPQNMTPERLGLTYRELHKQLVAKGLRKQIRFMGGDLIEGSRNPDSPLTRRSGSSTQTTCKESSTRSPRTSTGTTTQPAGSSSDSTTCETSSTASRTSRTGRPSSIPCPWSSPSSEPGARTAR